MAESPVSISRFEERLADSKARWYFSKDELVNSPSRDDNVDPAKELSYRQQAANLIQDMGHRLNLSQLCTATAIVYMHRFFIVHSFKSFQRFNVATASLFLAAKVEEQPRKLEYVARVSYSCQNRDAPPLDAQSDTCKKLMDEISYNELMLLETLGFEVAVEHPHQHVVKGTQLVRASKDLSQTAYFMSHNSLLLTTFCLQYRPTVVACVCIHLACQWKGIEIPLSADGKNWWEYVDPNITLKELNEHTGEFLKIYEMCPSRLRKKIMESMKMQAKLKPGESSGSHSSTSQLTNPGPPYSSRPSTSSDKQKGAVSYPPTQHRTQTSSHLGTSTKGGQAFPGKLHNAPGKQAAPSQPAHSGIRPDLKHQHLPRIAAAHQHHQKPAASSIPGVPIPPSKATIPREDQHKNITSSELKQSNSVQTKHYAHSHHHQAVPGHIPNAAKLSDNPTKHRLSAADYKHRTAASNHDGRLNALKRPHSGDAPDMKKARLEQFNALAPYAVQPPSPPKHTSSQVPPLPFHSISSSSHPPPLPSEPPPNFHGEFPPPPPPPPS